MSCRDLHFGGFSECRRLMQRKAVSVAVVVAVAVAAWKLIEAVAVWRLIEAVAAWKLI